MDICPRFTTDVRDWDVIVIGHIRWNRYFGENPDMPPRGDPSTCTSTVVRGTDAAGRPFVLLIDPTMRWTPPEFYFDLNRRTGLKPGQVTHCYCTHHHLDHYDALKYFPDAVWLAAEPVAGILRAEAKTVDGTRIRGVSGEFLPGIHAVPLPGHTDTLHGAAFRCRGKRILVAGDSVMTKNHLWNGTTEYQPDPAACEVAARTLADIRESFDIVVPGHDNLVVL